MGWVCLAGRGWVAALALAQAAPSLGASPERFLDIGRSKVEGSARPHDFVEWSGAAYFAASTETEGEELWKSDGTAEGTLLLKDIRPGASPSAPSRFVSLPSGLYFTADSGGGPSLWKTSGDAGSTSAVPALVDGPVSYDWLGDVPSSLTLVKRGADALVVYLSDGTAAGTREVFRKGGASPQLASRLLPVATGVVGKVAENCRTCPAPELWRVSLDGAPAELLAQGDLALLSTSGRQAYFTGRAGAELWRTDGTAEGTQRVHAFAEGSSPVVPLGQSGATAFFQREAPAKALWRSDGTSEGTRAVVTASGAPLTEASPVHVSGDSAFVLANGPEGRRLWRLAAAGHLATPISADVAALFSSQGHVLSLASNGNGRLTLSHLDAQGHWQTLGQFDAASPPADFAVIQGRLFFSGDAGFGQELWTSLFTEESTSQLRDIWPAASSSHPRALVAAGNRLFLLADDGQSGEQLWASDGRSAQGQPVTALGRGENKNVVSASGLAFFTHRTEGGGVSLWRSDGTPEGTFSLRSLSGDERCERGSLPGCAGNLTSAGGHLYFTDAVTPETSVLEEHRLWRTDGTEGGTEQLLGGIRHPLTELRPGMGSLFFSAIGQGMGATLWRSSGTAEGTGPVANLLPPRGSAFPSDIADGGSRVFFFARAPATTHPVLWASDGSEAGTKPMGDVQPGNPQDTLRGLAAGDGRAFFAADDGAHGWELWTSDGTPGGTRLVKDIAQGPASSSPSSIVVMDGAAYFWAHTAAQGWELWRSDGTSDGTFLVREIGPGAEGAVGAPAPLFPMAPFHLVALAASDGQHGTELWVTNGSEAGTVLMGDLFSGPRSSNPSAFALLDDALFFQAQDAEAGAELWKLPVGELAAQLGIPSGAHGNGAAEVELQEGATAGGCAHAAGSAGSAAAPFAVLAVLLASRRAFL